MNNTIYSKQFAKLMSRLPCQPLILSAGQKPVYRRTLAGFDITDMPKPARPGPKTHISLPLISSVHRSLGVGECIERRMRVEALAYIAVKRNSDKKTAKILSTLN